MGTSLHVGQSDLCYLTPDDLKRVLSDIAAFGFTRVRFEVPFHQVCGFPGSWNWDSVTRVRDAAASAGLTLLPVLGAHKPLLWKPDAGVYARFCATATILLAASEVEVWNEPNLTVFWPKADPATFYTWAQAAYTAIKAAAPQCTVILGGLAAADNQYTGFWKFLIPALGGNKNPNDFLTAMTTKAAGTRFFDKIGYHPYSLDAAFKMVAPTPKVFGIKQIQPLSRCDLVFTEVGFQGQTPAVQAGWLITQLGLMPKVDTYLYCWRDTGGETYGLVDTRNRPKDPYYTQVKQLVAGAR